ncbi:hypothetical protein [Massilibacteroides sp.]|uniref:hypothetical protein n=1 Tax=Massilibacteroides sp. TaxID=2034766 RepID=UPI0026369A8C|nr:hypothetical protein [Massilibacteroides sp.]MDD4516580.1 hypothetical protein [Massilibacteroides sp.]
MDKNYIPAYEAVISGNLNIASIVIKNSVIGQKSVLNGKVEIIGSNLKEIKIASEAAQGQIINSFVRSPIEVLGTTAFIIKDFYWNTPDFPLRLENPQIYGPSTFYWDKERRRFYYLSKNGILVQDDIGRIIPIEVYLNDETVVQNEQLIERLGDHRVVLTREPRYVTGGRGNARIFSYESVVSSRPSPEITMPLKDFAYASKHFTNTISTDSIMVETNQGQKSFIEGKQERLNFAFKNFSILRNKNFRLFRDNVAISSKEASMVFVEPRSKVSYEVFGNRVFATRDGSKPIDIFHELLQKDLPFFERAPIPLRKARVSIKENGRIHLIASIETLLALREAKRKGFSSSTNPISGFMLRDSSTGKAIDLGISLTKGSSFPSDFFPTREVFIDYILGIFDRHAYPDYHKAVSDFIIGPKELPKDAIWTYNHLILTLGDLSTKSILPKLIAVLEEELKMPQEVIMQVYHFYLESFYKTISSARTDLKTENHDLLIAADKIVRNYLKKWRV